MLIFVAMRTDGEGSRKGIKAESSIKETFNKLRRRYEASGGNF